MIPLLRQRLLAVFTVLALLGGLAHQIAERFSAEPCVETAACCDRHGGDEPAKEGQQDGKACNHALCCHSIVAVVETAAPVVVGVVATEDRIAERSERPPGVDPADIEHPPQLA
jgi:hypothetical protein